MDIRDTIMNSIGDLINKENTNIIYIEKINNYHIVSLLELNWHKGINVLIIIVHVIKK